MTKFCSIFLVLIIFLQAVAGKKVPGYLKDFYRKAKESDCMGDDVLKAGFHSTEGDDGHYKYCQRFSKGKAIYLKGDRGTLVNMDVDCDGGIMKHKHDGRCASSTDTQPITAFQDLVSKHGVDDLDPTSIPYIVFGNTGNGSLSFDPSEYGIKPLSVMAVVCNNKLVYGIWGDTNGHEHEPKVGEASISLATACFGKHINGNNGHDQQDVLFLAFPGEEAVAGDRANWKAKNFKGFQKSIDKIGDRLVARFKHDWLFNSGSTVAINGVYPYLGLAAVLLLLI